MLLSLVEAEQFSLLSSFFSRIFAKEPDEERWQEFTSLKAISWLNKEARTDELKAFEGLQKSLDISLKSVILDYNRLFIGPDDLKAPPWASLYLSDKKHVFSSETLKVRSFYEKYQLNVGNNFHEPADHISFEFHFIAILFLHFQQAHEESKEYICRDICLFLENHFLPWLPLCLENIIQHAQTEFYKNAALLASFTIKDFQKLLDTAKTLSFDYKDER